MIKRLLFAAIIVGLGICLTKNCQALGSDALLANSMTGSEFEMFTQNNITFYDPDECLSGNRKNGSSSLCGDSATEKYWSAISKYIDDPIKIAGIVGNLIHEGGMNPAAWEGGPTGEGGGINRHGNLLLGWDYYYNCRSSKTGVGAFAITSNLCGYLRSIESDAPDFLEYFKNTTDYSYNFLYHPDCNLGEKYHSYGDCLLEKIGSAEFERLVEFEIKYAIESFNPTRTEQYMNKTFSTPAEAAYWWEKKWEVPQAGSSNQRMASAEKVYDELKDFKCETNNAIASTDNDSDDLNMADMVSPDITIIGDSIAMQSEKELKAKFPNGFYSKVGSRHSTSAGMCPGDEGGLSVLQKLSTGSGTVIDQHSTGACEGVSVGPYSLAKNVVWELGTNSVGANESTIQSVIDLIGEDRNLFLVTTYNGNDLNGSGNIAEMYRKVADETPNVYLVDWRAAVENEESRYITRADHMAVHPTDEGKKLLADLIYRAVTGEATTGVADCNASVTGTAGEAIKEIAIRLSWPEGTEQSKWYHNSGVPEEFTKAAEKLGFDGYPSCSRFASMVILESGVDDKFESILRPFGSRKNNLYTLEDYFASSPNWKQVSYEESQPGDIIINHEHVEVYIGDEKKAHAGEVGSPSPLDNNGPHIDPLSERDKHGDYKWYRSTNGSGSISVSGNGVGCNMCSTSGGGNNGNNVSSEIGEEGLTFEQAKQFMMNYGANKNNSSKIPVQKGGGSAWGNSGCNGDGGSNCVAFSAFFIHKFTDSLRNTGSGNVTAKNMSNVDGKGQEPKVWAVFSGGTSAKPHTGVILGYHDGEWIVGHASCHDSGRGAGTGGDGTYRGRGTGVGFVIKSSDLKTAMMNYNLATPGFAYPKNVNVAAIEKYLETGE